MQLIWHFSMHCPAALQVELASQTPQVPAHPSLPHCFPVQSGVHSLPVSPPVASGNPVSSPVSIPVSVPPPDVLEPSSPHPVIMPMDTIIEIKSHTFHMLAAFIASPLQLIPYLNSAAV
jgi:hypothetical protein